MCIVKKSNDEIFFSHNTLNNSLFEIGSVKFWHLVSPLGLNRTSVLQE